MSEEKPFGNPPKTNVVDFPTPAVEFDAPAPQPANEPAVAQDQVSDAAPEQVPTATIGGHANPTAWPSARPVDGLVYEFFDPRHKVRMAAMTQGTYRRFKADMNRAVAHITKLQGELDRLRARQDNEKRIITPGGGEIIRN